MSIRIEFFFPSKENDLLLLKRVIFFSWTELHKKSIKPTVEITAAQHPCAFLLRGHQRVLAIPLAEWHVLFGPTATRTRADFKEKLISTTSSFYSSLEEQEKSTFFPTSAASATWDPNREKEPGHFVGTTCQLLPLYLLPFVIMLTPNLLKHNRDQLGHLFSNVSAHLKDGSRSGVLMARHMEEQFRENGMKVLSKMFMDYTTSLFMPSIQIETLQSVVDETNRNKQEINQLKQENKRLSMDLENLKKEVTMRRQMLEEGSLTHYEGGM